MEKTQLEMIHACLSEQRRVFRYVPDSYAIQLLQDYIGDGMAIARLRQSPYARLLSKPIVRDALARAGKGVLEPWHLELARGEYTHCKPLHFMLTLGEWGTDKHQRRAWHQLTRTGYHLVLQLNFASDHVRYLRSLLNTPEVAPFSYRNHPVRRDGDYETLAWARIDLDFASDEALIEEIQSDWVRKSCEPYHDRIYGSEAMQAYREALRPYARVWSEAILAAAVRFIRHELGIGKVFYNSFETGNKLKGLERETDLPPRSLYTELPKKFCFEPTHKAPNFLQPVRFVNYLQRSGQGVWFKLPIQGDCHDEKSAA
ncbi:hypothetical protein [Thiofilum flexile]|uniref:hypothetical protein n=1 Tax=Thiofilum flexile TaxID=125627 RepID=UPI00035FC94F|nr:hypothetical protein [Thiofilum flexile]